MQKPRKYAKLISCIGCLCLAFVCASPSLAEMRKAKNPAKDAHEVSPATAYTNDHKFFTEKFWEKASLEDVKKHLIKGGNLNTYYTGPSEGNELWGQKPLVFALASHASPEIIEFLVKNGANISSDAMVEAGAGSLENLKTLVKLGGNVNAYTYYSATALHLAAYFHKLENVEFLLQAGALANIKDQSGDTPLALAHSGQASKDIRTKQTIIRRLSAAQKRHGPPKIPKDAGIITYKVKKNTYKHYHTLHNYNVIDFWRIATLEDVKQSFIPGEDINKRFKDYTQNNNDERTPLAYACEYSTDPKIVEFLIKNGAKITDTVMVNAGATDNVEILKMLVKHGGNVNIKNENGFTPLMVAVEYGLVPTVAYLLEQGAKVNVRNVFHEHILSYGAATKGRPDRAPIEQMLRDAGARP